MTPGALQTQLQRLHKLRVKSAARIRARRRRRPSLNASERVSVLATTWSKCHICGGAIGPGRAWQADHVLARSGGGLHAIDNYLPAHALCNNYRWDYLPLEFQMILKLGVWIRTQIERGSSVGVEAARGFTAHERHREGRRRPKPSTSVNTALQPAGRAGG